jgi:hypothetical protein
LTDSGKALSCGSNACGQLAQPDIAEATLPTPIRAFKDHVVQHVAASNVHSAFFVSPCKYRPGFGMLPISLPG